MGDAHAIVLDGRSDILQKDRTPVFLRFSRPITYFNKILVNQDEENDVEERAHLTCRSTPTTKPQGLRYVALLAPTCAHSIIHGGLL